MAVRDYEVSSDHQMILDNILEFIEDQGRIVTYKWLSRELKIHVNLSKQLLHYFLIKYRKEHGSGLAASYIISGILKDQTSHKVCIANESDTEKVKSSFSVITSDHVYSIQKCPLKDSNSLYITELENWEGGHEHKFSGIKATKKIKTDTEELTTTQPSVSASTQSLAATEPKKDVKNVKNTTPKASIPVSNKNGPKSNALATMFKNQETKPKKSPQNEKKPIKEEIKVTEPEKSNSDEKEKNKKSSKKPVEVKRNGSVKGKNTLSLKKKASVTGGKRRRIIEDSSSSEDSSSECENEEEDPIPGNQETPMDVDEAFDDEDPITSYQPTEKYEDENKNSNSEPGMIQHYKRVDETYLDEDGYMNTLKVMKLVQEPELTNKSTETKTSPPTEKIKPKEPVNNSKGKKSTKNTANQPTLMNFFKKA